MERKIEALLLGNRSWGSRSREDFAILFARVSLGIFFAISGAGKLFVASRHRQMYQTIGGAGLPFPHFTAWFVSAVEFAAGCLLIPGLLSSPCCAALIIDMGVAIATVRIGTIPAGTSFVESVDDFLYLPETLYIILLIWLICAGPGQLSLDWRIFGRREDG